MNDEGANRFRSGTRVSQPSVSEAPTKDLLGPTIKVTTVMNDRSMNVYKKMDRQADMHTYSLGM